MQGRDHLGYDRDRTQVVRAPWLGGDVLSYADPRPHDVLDVLDIAVHRRPDAVAVVDALTQASWTVQELADAVAATAAELRAGGLRPGDGVGIAAGNSADHLATILACAELGAVAVGLAPRLAAPLWRYQLEHSGCRLLLQRPCERPPGQAGGRGAAGGPAAAPLGGGLEPARVAAARRHPQARSPRHRLPGRVHLGVDRSTQGQPGGAPGERALRHGLRPVAAAAAGRVHRGAVPPRLHQRDARPRHPRAAGRRPPGHDADRQCTHLGATAGGVRRRLGLRRPLLVAAGAAGAGPARRGAAALRLAGAGGSPFPDALRDGPAQRLPGAELLNIYGLSETHSPATVLRGQDLWTHAGSAGRALEVVEVEVRDDAGTPLGVDERGEVWLRSSLVTTGYAQDEPASTAALVDGALRTGDVGVLEPGGPAGPVLRLLDRVKDLVNRAGNKVYSTEVERVLAEHPAEASRPRAPGLRPAAAGDLRGTQHHSLGGRGAPGPDGQDGQAGAA